MIMEHRLHKRRGFSTSVKVYLAGESVGVGYVDEICTSGMSIHHSGINLEIGQIVTIDFLHLDVRERCMRAMVIHASSGHIGFMFDYDVRLDELISHTIREKNNSVPQWRCYG